jgi:hypothetical protein
MANTNAPFGFRHLGWARGGPGVTGGTIERKIAYDNSTPICQGDVVQSLATGYVAIGAASVQGSNTAGIFMGCKYLSTSQGRVVYSNYWPSGDHAYDGTAIIVPIAGVPPQLFVVQSLSTKYTFADIGANTDIDVGTQVISGGFGQSGMTVTHSVISATATYPFRVVDLWSNVTPPGAPGTYDGSYNWVVVQSNPDYELGIA